MISNFTANLFRAHIAVFAFELPSQGVAFDMAVLGDAKIHQFDLAIVGQNHIFRTDVSMDDERRITSRCRHVPCEFHRARNARDDVRDNRKGDRLAPSSRGADHLDQVSPVEELHDQHSAVLPVQYAVDLHCIGVANECTDSSLAFEHRSIVRIVA